jgi:ketosteroid isomerase-like protein
MGTTENKKIVSKAFSDASSGNTDAFLGAFDDAFKFTVMGKTKISGTCIGKSECLKKVFLSLGSKLAGTQKVIQENFIAEGDYVVMQSRGTAPTKTGGTYDNSYCQVFRLKDGKIVEWTEYLDTEEATRVLNE